MDDERITVYLSSKRRPITKAFYAALGQIAAEFANLEDAIRRLLAYLLQTNLGLVVAAGEGMGNLLQMCQRLAAFDHRLDDTHVEKLAQLSAVIGQVQTQRNAALHAQWYATSLAGYFYGARSRRPSPRSAPVLEDDLYWTTESALDLVHNLKRVVAIVEAYENSLPGWQRHIQPIARVAWNQFNAFWGDLVIPPGADSPPKDAGLA